MELILPTNKIIYNPFLLAPPRLNLTKSSLFKAPATAANSSTGVTSSSFSRFDQSNSKPFSPASSHLNSTVPLFNLSSSSTTNTSVTFSSTTLSTSGSSVSWSRKDVIRVPSCKNNPFSKFGASNLDSEENEPLATFYTSSNFSGSQTLNETKLPISSTPFVNFKYPVNKEAAVICSDKTEKETKFPISSTPFVNFKYPSNKNEGTMICSDKTEVNQDSPKEAFKDNSCDKTDSYILDKEMLDLLQHDFASEETDSSSSVKEMK